MKAIVLIAALAAGGADGTRCAVTEACPGRAIDWRQVSTSADRARLRDWRATWLAAVTAARAADAGGVAGEAQLFEPDRALAKPLPPAGAYRCRSFKLGTKGSTPRAFTVDPWVDCQVSVGGDTIRFAKTSGPQRAKGRIYPDGAVRGVFLGALILGDESRALGYGRDATRDMAGLVERVGPSRWRIAFPDPHFEAQLEVLELVPAG